MATTYGNNLNSGQPSYGDYGDDSGGDGDDARHCHRVIHGDGALLGIDIIVPFVDYLFP